MKSMKLGKLPFHLLPTVLLGGRRHYRRMYAACGAMALIRVDLPDLTAKTTDLHRLMLRQVAEVQPRLAPEQRSPNGAPSQRTG
jgi:hypothetical protein